MNIYLPQSEKTRAELLWLCSTEALLKSGQSSRLLLCITQDALTSGHIFTAGEYRGKKFYDKVKISKETWNDAVSSVDEWDMNYILKKMDHIRDVLEWKGIKDTDEFMYSGHGLISMLLPDDFEFTYNPTNVVIVRGVMLSGTLGKPTLGDSHSSIVHKLEKDYGPKLTVDFVSYYQFLVNHCLRCRGFSIGIEDCIPTRVEDVKGEIIKSFTEAHIIETTEKDDDLRERKVNNALNGATAVGQRISKDALQFDNSLNVMVLAGSKGSYVNISQIRAIVGQQNVEGKRIPLTFGGRTLPHYNMDQEALLKQIEKDIEERTKKMKEIEELCDEDKKELLKEINEEVKKKIQELIDERRLLYESRGFVTHCFMEGLTPQEFFFHAEGGREGVIDTAIKTSLSGYIQRKLVKKMEDIVKSYATGLVVNSKNMVIQFNYQNNFDPAKLVRVGDKMSFVNIKSIVEHLNVESEWEEWQEKKKNYQCI